MELSAQRSRIHLLLVLLFLLTPVMGLGERPVVESTPFLRVDPGMHTDPIRGIAVDAAGRFLATAAGDKTCRIWDLRSGALLQTLRPPIGAAEEGALGAVALSPDGQWVALGGNTGLLWEGTASIYVFERTSGRLVRRIHGLPAPVSHLAYSADGKRLAAGLARTGGIRVFDSGDGAPLGADGDYGATVHWVEFDRSGRLVTSSSDGFVRLYDQSLKRLAKVAAKGGKEPFSVSFSPDDLKVALGFVDSAQVDVLSGFDLTLLYQPNVKGVSEPLHSVAWSVSGDRLYAAGSFGTSTDNYKVRIWERSGEGESKDVNLGGTNTILALKTLQDGRIVFGGAAPAWGLLGKDGELLHFMGTETADFRAAKDCFKLDDTGKRVQFCYQSYSRNPAVFSTTERTLVLGPSSGHEFRAPRSHAWKIDLRFGAKGDSHTYLNRKQLFVDPPPVISCHAVAPDGNWFVLGSSSGFIYSVTSDGKERWQVLTISPVWAVNISNNGRVVVAGLLDGTIRWFRAQDGQELLAVFLHADRKRWVAWTPSGFYDASIGAETLVGWQVNRGLEAASDWFPVSRFRERFYRPDVIARVVDALDEVTAIRQADEAAGRVPQKTVLARILPPVVRILSPIDGAIIGKQSLEMRASIRSVSGD
ncbi:MAG TPA: WD40 repeat domain-containing protein, partial [Thermoanaerobaculia bacterium]|nr:WD40 repeat domain-containing protein [Thermoanaerobaculia bacterium]